MRETVPSRPLATHTAFPPTATPAGPPPTLIVCTTWFVVESIRETVLSFAFVTQTASGPDGDFPRRSSHGDLRDDLAALRVDDPDCVRCDRGARRRPAALRQEHAESGAHERRGEGRDRSGPGGPGRRQRLAISSAAASASSPSRPSKGAGRGRLQRGEVLLEPRRDELVEPLGLVQVLELVLAQVSQGDVRDGIVAEQLARRLRDEHLAAVPGCGDWSFG